MNKTKTRRSIMQLQYEEISKLIKERELQTSRRQRMKEHLFKGGNIYTTFNILAKDF